MGHDHDHAHAHPHAHETSGWAFVIGVVLNVGIVVIEATYGVVARSMALLADAGHNLGDVLGLVLAGGAMLLARKRATTRRTYGFRRATLLAALTNAIFLLVTTGAVAWEAIRRLRAPEPVDARTVMVVAAIAVVVNGASAALFFAGRKRDLNVRAAFFHLAADAAIAVGVIVATAIMLATGWAWVDPMTGILVAALILVSTWSLLRSSADLVLDAVPEHIDIAKIRVYLEALPGVVEVHDLHVWAMSTTEAALTAHLVMRPSACDPRFLGDVTGELHAQFGIEHATLQLDAEEAPDPCRLAPAGKCG
jgi:cobalt-zinc-cadmium efflux system protein